MKNIILGFTQDYNNCDCCGRDDLKGTYAIQNENGVINYYGCVCAQKFMGGVSKNQLKAAVEIANKEMISQYTEKCYTELTNAFAAQTKMSYIEFNNSKESEIILKSILATFPMLNQNKLYY